MMQPPKDGPRFDAPGALNDPSNRRILAHISQEDVAQVLLAHYDNMVETFSADRGNQPLHISVLPGRAGRRRMIANAKRANASDE